MFWIVPAGAAPAEIERRNMKICFVALALLACVWSGDVGHAPYGIRVNSVNMAQTCTPVAERAEEFVAAKKRAEEGFGMGSIKTMSLLTYTDSGHRASFPREQDPPCCTSFPTRRPP